jgi:hypothetical protein
MPTPEEEVASRTWLRARQIGLVAAMFLWWALAYLLTPGFVTPGAIWAFFVGAGAWWGVWRFDLLISVEREYMAMRHARKEADAIAQEWGSGYDAFNGASDRAAVEGASPALGAGGRA